MTNSISQLDPRENLNRSTTLRNLFLKKTHLVQTRAIYFGFGDQKELLERKETLFRTVSPVNRVLFSESFGNALM